MPIARYPDDLPLILCGPMLRRTEPDSVSVFLALKHPRQVNLGVKSQGQEKLTGVATTIPLGRNLHVVVVTADSGTALQRGQFHQYDLTLTRQGPATTTDTGPATTNLQQNGLLTGSHALGYQDDELPGFVLAPTEPENLRIVHASCRKPHGGDRDVLPVLDHLIAEAGQDPQKRPHNLFLTGDQIYADDVSPHLLCTIHETGRHLLDWSETMPIVGATFGSPWSSFGMRSFVRGDVVKNQGHFTSGYREAHLAFLGEFYTMYLLAWSDSLWPRESTGSDTPSLANTAEAIKFDELPGPTVLSRIKHQAKAEESRTSVLGYAATMRRVRRALANIPTYMMFDDHEVTDDWYLTWNWVTSVRGSQVGRRLLRNGLLGYAIFQDWGNQPADYQTGFGKQILDAATCTFPAGGTIGTPPVDQTPALLDDVLDIAAIPSGVNEDTYTPPGRSARKCWDYELVEPGRRVIVLDTRTWRTFQRDPAAGKGDVGLLSDAALGAQLTNRRPATPDDYTIVVSPAPVLGYQLVEEFIQPEGRRLLGAEAVDYEAWCAHPAQFQKFLAELARFGRVIMLSGDVHYAFSNDTAYFRDDQPGSTPARLVQLCSSSLKNEATLTRALGTLGNLVNVTGWVGFDSDIAPAVRTQIKNILTGPLWNSNIGLLDRILGGDRLYTRIMERGGFEKPAVLPTEGWLEPGVRNIADTLAQGADWRYRIRFAEDDRSWSQRKADNKSLDGTASPKKLPFLPTEVVGYDNLGLVSFAGWGSGTQVVHRLAWQAREIDHDPINLVHFAEHRLPFETPTASERPEVG